MLLTACESLCTSLDETFGAQLVELAAIALGFVLVAWKQRKTIAAVRAEAREGIDKAHERASAAKAEARDAMVQLARIEGSLRPTAIATPVPPSSSPAPEPVAFPLSPELVRSRPSILDGSLERLPAPSRVPDVTGPTPVPPHRRKED
jgi:hypothetical protein